MNPLSKYMFLYLYGYAQPSAFISISEIPLISLNQNWVPFFSWLLFSFNSYISELQWPTKHLSIKSHVYPDWCCNPSVFSKALSTVGPQKLRFHFLPFLARPSPNNEISIQWMFANWMRLIKCLLNKWGIFMSALSSTTQHLLPFSVLNGTLSSSTASSFLLASPFSPAASALFPLYPLLYFPPTTMQNPMKNSVMDPGPNRRLQPWLQYHCLCPPFL